MQIVIVDGQGGGIGSRLIERLKKTLREDVRIVALGTNATATAAMMAAGASAGACGENAIVVNAAKADVIAGPIGIILADAMMGELTERMASAISRSGAPKILVPVGRCGISIAGAQNMVLDKALDEAVQLIVRHFSQRGGE
ncbi:MAG: DUF3842 family protein [Christensenellales bacterium]|jgi:hypothetical protein